MKKYTCISYFYSETDPYDIKTKTQHVPSTIKNRIAGQPDIVIDTLDKAYEFFKATEIKEGYIFLNCVIIENLKQPVKQ